VEEQGQDLACGIATTLNVNNILTGGENGTLTSLNGIKVVE